MENLNTKLYTMKNTINKMKTELNSVHNKNTNYSFQDNKIQKKKISIQIIIIIITI